MLAANEDFSESDAQDANQAELEDSEKSTNDESKTNTEQVETTKTKAAIEKVCYTINSVSSRIRHSRSVQVLS